MSWPCRLLTAEEYEAKRAAGQLQVGDMWFAPWLDRGKPTALLGPNYFRNHKARRPPLVVRLPGPCDFCVDSPFIHDGKPYGEGWDVSGDAPRITVLPSIDLGGVGGYHGHISNGVISDDVAGRKFE